MLKLVLVLVALVGLVRGDSAQLYDEIHLDTVEILRLRGFTAESHLVTTDDGYVLEVVRALNPLIGALADRDVILFVHGILTSANCFLINSADVRPRDLSGLLGLSLEELRRALAEEPSARSLAFLALNLGHEVWLLNRRGSVARSRGLLDGSQAQTPSSLGQALLDSLLAVLPAPLRARQLARFDPLRPLTSLVHQVEELVSAASATVNSAYWNYSLDEQAAFDIRNCVDYVRELTGRAKISAVGHSAGGALLLMALTASPELADKLNHVVLWSPSLDLGHALSDQLKYRLAPLLASYVGPIPAPGLVPVIQSIGLTLCSTALARRTVCSLIDDAVFGPSGGQQLIQPGTITSAFNPISSHEAGQLGQSNSFGSMHYFDHGQAAKNLAAYGTAEPPVYDVSRITSRRLVFYAGITDGLVAARDVSYVVSNLSVPAELNVIEGPDVYFNHVSYFIHQNVSQLVVIPSLRSIQSEPS